MSKIRTKKKLVFGVGMNDSNYPVHEFSYKLDSKGNKVIDKRLWTCPFYEKWYEMLRRVYSKSKQENNPAYEGTRVCQEWLVLSNFKRWMEQEDYFGKDLDKDLLGDGKLYSPETCCWLPAEANQFFKERSRFTNCAVGVSPKNQKFQARVMNPFSQCREYLGVFCTIEEAHIAWKSRKHELSCMWAEKLEELGYPQRVLEGFRIKYR